MSKYLLPPQVMYAATEAGMKVSPDSTRMGWLVISKDGEPFCTVLKGALVEGIVKVLH